MNMDVPAASLATVISLSYNSPDLYGSIYSVLIQQNCRIQYILVDDGSEGFSRTPVIDFVNSHRTESIQEFLLIDKQQNQGTVKAINSALKHARGDYIFTLAGDDRFLDSNVISDWMAKFEESGALVITAYRNVFDQNLQHFLRRMPSRQQVKKIRRYTPKRLFMSIAAENFIFGCCTAYSKQCFDQYGCYDERYRLIEDHPMNLRLLRNNISFVFWDRVVVCYRNSGASSEFRFNQVYERDCDLIFAHEVHPYTQALGKTHHKYKVWKKKRHLLSKIHDGSGRSVKKTCLKVYYYALTPLQTCGKIIRRTFKYIISLFRT